jgi:hypothetical protein
LNKWEIFEYTLPQITELMKKTSKHVKFLVKLQTAAFGGGGEEPDSAKPSGETEDDGEYKVLDEDGLNELMQVFAGA